MSGRALDRRPKAGRSLTSPPLGILLILVQQRGTCQHVPRSTRRRVSRPSQTYKYPPRSPSEPQQPLTSSTTIYSSLYCTTPSSTWGKMVDTLHHNVLNIGPGTGSGSCTWLADPASFVDDAKRTVYLGGAELRLAAVVGGAPVQACRWHWTPRQGMRSLVPPKMLLPCKVCWS